MRNKENSWCPKTGEKHPSLIIVLTEKVSISEDGVAFLCKHIAAVMSFYLYVEVQWYIISCRVHHMESFTQKTNLLMLKNIGIFKYIYIYISQDIIPVGKVLSSLINACSICQAKIIFFFILYRKREFIDVFIICHLHYFFQTIGTFDRQRVLDVIHLDLSVILFFLSKIEFQWIFFQAFIFGFLVKKIHIKDFSITEKNQKPQGPTSC